MGFKNIKTILTGQPLLDEALVFPKSLPPFVPYFLRLGARLVAAVAARLVAQLTEADRLALLIWLLASLA